MAGPQSIRAVDETNLPSARAFLEDHAETSMLLLGNLDLYGPRIGSAFYSGNYKIIEEDGQVCAVFCLTRRTMLLAAAGGRIEFARTIVDACREEPIAIGGVMGEWNLAESIWSILRTNPGFNEVYAAKEILHARDLNHAIARDASPHVRHLAVTDFEQWDLAYAAYHAEEGIPLHGTPSEREALFRRNAEARRWWGYFEDGRLLAMAGLNAVYKQLGQVGGVYTVPDRRRLGLSRTTMNALLADSVHVHRLERLILFTGEQNRAARHLYDTLGFLRIGHFALLICDPA
jgi:predicted GNAT family acetyltransferase